MELVAEQSEKTPDTPIKKKITDDFHDRQTPELIVALCGAVGSGTSTVADQIEKYFKSLTYDVDTIKVSTLIERHSKTVPTPTRYERIKTLQDAGNELRGSNGGQSILAQLVIKEIVAKRTEYAAKTLKKDIKDINYGKEARIRWRHVTIIDSLKHPKEVELLQNVYGKMFYMFGVLCSDHKRKTRLENGGETTATQAIELMERDKKERDNNGQQLLKTLQHSDFFLRNTRENVNSLKIPIQRFINLLLGQNDLTPTIDEFGMYMAESSARRSGCMSRQVGAAILTEKGDIVSMGRNDVPRATGGLYGTEDDNYDARCFNWHDHACFNDKGKKNIYSKLETKIKEILDNDALEPKVTNIIDELKDDSEIKDLLEYSRAVHAEMDAITSAARNGVHPLKNTILYSTTFPCHHCARHIVASGIKRVYYIEPYEKSLALKLHEDSISLDSQGVDTSTEKVIFLHFEGVAPKRYLSLFSCNNRKKDGKLREVQLHDQNPTDALLLDTFIEYESKIADHVEEVATKA